MPITEEEWKRRCAARYMERGAIPEIQAIEFAEACWDQRVGEDDSPERAADEDMTYWEDDGE